MKKRTGRRLTKHIFVRKGKLSSTPADDTRPTVEKIAESDGGSKNDPVENRRSARAFLIGAAQAAVIIPILFYLRFGEINAFALSFTGFIVVLCLLIALGYSIPNKPEHQTPVEAPP